jgi:hypothetical protein
MDRHNGWSSSMGVEQVVLKLVYAGSVIPVAKKLRI